MHRFVTEPGLVITIGPPGAGKSTWAENNIPATTLRLERDRFREALFGTRMGYHTSPLGYKDRSRVLQNTMIAAMLNWPNNCFALTDTGLRGMDASPFIKFVERYSDHEKFSGKANINLVVFNTSRDELLERNKTRPEAHRVPDHILTHFIDLFEDPEAWWRTSGHPVHYVG